jgi:metal-responsive CopG/Arc/MetJ family transcriptional regulator
MKQRRRAVRKSFTMSITDVLLLNEIVAKCGFLSASEAVRTLIRVYAQSICPRKKEDPGALAAGRG